MATTSRSISIPSPGRSVARASIPFGSIGWDSLATSSRHGTSEVTASQMMYDGVASPSSIEAAVETGPCGLCGASATRWISARAAIRRTSVSPPQWVMSGWITLQAPFVRSSLNGAAPTRRSPVAIGVRTARWIAAMSSTRSGQHGSSNQKRSNCSSAAANRCPMRGLGRAWQSTMMSMLVADGIAHRRDAALGMPHGREALERHRRRHRHRLERGEALLDHAGRELAEPLRLAALVEVLHLPLAEMAVEPHVVAHRPAPELVARDAVHLAEDVPERDVDAAHRRAADDVVAVPEVLAEHHLPEVLDPRRVLADDQLGQILDGADDRPRVPLERRLAPAVEAVLVGDDADEHPVAHPRVADVRLDRGDLHAAPLSPSSSSTLASIRRAISLPSTLVFVIP